MAAELVLCGYEFSVYTRVVSAVLAVKGRTADRVEVNPFGPPDLDYLTLHPFARVPVLSHGTFTLYETGAITRYLDAAFPVPCLTPEDPRARARMDQVLGIVDSYLYWPLVRQVFGQRIFAPREGGTPDESVIAEGLAKAETVLGALEEIAAEGLVLDGQGISLADCHLAPMIDYFAMAPEGAEMLSRFVTLSSWWEHVQRLDWMEKTRPDL